MLKYLYGLLSIGTYFFLPLSYIYFYHLKDTQTEKYSLIPIAFIGLIILIMIIVLTSVLFKFKRLYYVKLLVITFEVLAVLYVGVMFFEYITVNAGDIREFIIVTIVTTSIGFIPTSLLLHRLQKENII